MLFLSVLISTAWAEGSSSLALAPWVNYATSETGSTANGLHVFDNVSGIQGWNSFWRLKVRAGDRLRIDWEGPPKSGTHLDLFEGSTTDYTVGRARPLVYQGQNPEGKNELAFEAAKAGTLILDVRTQAQEGTMYSFTARVHHHRKLGD
jgi:hypothetical protein